jgi:hypothetical protein
MSLSLARNLAVVFSLCAGLSLATRARGDDLDRFKAENELKAQKIAGEVKAGLAQARTLERSNPARARDILRKLESKLEDDVVLTTRQRTAYLRQVRDQLRLVIQAARTQEAAEEAAAHKALTKQKQLERRDLDKQSSQQGPAGVAKDYFKAAQGRLDAAAKAKAGKEGGFVGAMGDIELSASKINEERITERFRLATERRAQQLTAKEKKLLKTLNSVMSVDFTTEKFREVIDYLQEKTGQPIIIDENSLKEANVEPDDPVTFKAKKITVRTILKKILGDKGLTYIIQEGTIQVVTPQRARESMVVRTYPIGDLLGVNRPFGFWGQLVAAQMAQNLIETIQTTVDPEIWTRGATITYNPAAMAIVVRAPAELHYSLGYGGK